MLPCIMPTYFTKCNANLSALSKLINSFMLQRKYTILKT